MSSDADAIEFEDRLADEKRELAAELEGGDGAPEHGNDVDWAALWDDVGFDADKMMSTVQLRLAVAVSDEVPGYREDDALKLAEQAVEENRLTEVTENAEHIQDLVSSEVVPDE